MKRMFVFSAILFAIAVSSNLHSVGTSRVTPEDYYCGFDYQMKECTWVLDGSVCIAYDDCTPLIVKPEPEGDD